MPITQITVKVGFIKDIEMPDGEIVQQKEEITFCTKQFFIDDPPKLQEKDTLLFRRNILYLVSFKRLQGSFDVYDKVVSKLLKHEDLTEVVDFEATKSLFYLKDDDKPLIVSGFIRFNIGERLLDKYIDFPLEIMNIIATMSYGYSDFV